MELQIQNIISNTLNSEKLKKQSIKYNQMAVWIVVVGFILGALLLVLLIQFKDVLWTIFLVLGIALIVGSIFASLIVLKINSNIIKKQIMEVSKMQFEVWTLQASTFFNIELLMSFQGGYVGKFNKIDFEILKIDNANVLKIKKDDIVLPKHFFEYELKWNEKKVLNIKKSYLTCAVQYASSSLSKNINVDFVKLLEILNNHAK